MNRKETIEVGRDKEFDILSNKYNILLAKTQDLQEQLTTKQEQWKKRDEDFAIMEKLVRELCQDVLAKDKKEMVLGREYSWAETPVNELIIKARKVFRVYNSERTDTMRKIMDMLEERRAQVESLEEEIVMLKTRSPQGNGNLTVQELEKQIRREQEEKKHLNEQIANSKTLSPEVQEAVANGKIDLGVVRKTIAEGDAEIVEEDWIDDEAEVKEGTVVSQTVLTREKKLLQEAANENQKAKITLRSMPVSRTQKAAQDRKELKNKLDKEYTVKILSELEKKVTDNGWLVMEVIGKYGLSTVNDVLDKALDIALERNFMTTQSRLRTNLTDLCNIGILRRERVVTPFSRMFSYCLTTEGARIFKIKFDRQAVLSEMDRIIAEHDNLNHGYGIKEVAEKIKETGCYEKVEIWNRKDNAITVSGSITYIPDIIATSKNGEHTYIEFELDHWNQRNFNIKCNKMLVCTNTINFIVPNKEDVPSILNKLTEWAKSRGTGGNMRHVIIRVTTAGAVKGADLTQNNNWMYTFRPIKDKEPVNHF